MLSELTVRDLAIIDCLQKVQSVINPRNALPVLSNVLFNAVFMRFWGHVGIAASTTVVSLLTCAALFGLLRRKPEWAARA